MEVKLLAGRGSAGDTNWGASVTRNPTTLKRELKALQPFFGKRVFLSGGGGWGYRRATLKSAEIVNYHDMGKALRAKLTNVKPSLGGRGNFEPWIDSWQICVPV